MNLFENLQLMKESKNPLINEFKEFLASKNAQYIYNELGETKDGMQIVIYDGDWKHEHLYMKHLIDEFFTSKGIDISINSEEIGESDQDTFSARYDVIFNAEPKEYTADVKSLKFTTESIRYQVTCQLAISNEEVYSEHSNLKDAIASARKAQQSFMNVKIKDLEDGNSWHDIDNAEQDLNDGLYEGKHYGGAFDIIDTAYFTRDDLDEFSNDVIEKLSDATHGDIVANVVDCYLDDDINELELTVSYSEDEHTHKEKIDMRKIKVPKDLIKAYSHKFVNEFLRYFNADIEHEEIIKESISDIDSLINKVGGVSKIKEIIKDTKSAYPGINDDEEIADMSYGRVEDKISFEEWSSVIEYVHNSLMETVDINLDEYEYISTGTGYNKGWSLYRKIVDGKGVWAAEHQQTKEVVPINYDQVQGFEPIKLDGIKKLQKDLGDMLLPKRESNNIISVEYTYDGDDISDYKGHIKVSTDNDEAALNIAEKYIKDNHPEINPRNFIISNDNYDNVDIIDSNGKKLRESNNDDNDSSVNKKLIKKICDEFKYGPLVDAAYSSSFYTQNQQRFMTIPISSNSDQSDYNSYKKDLQKVFPKCDIYCVPDDYEILIDVTNLYQELTESNDEDYDDNAATFLDTLEKEVKEAAHKFMLSVGFPEDEADDYLSVSTDINDDYVMVAVGAELGYESISKLCDELNKVIVKHDKDAYFEPECPGRIVAYLFGIKNESLTESNHNVIEDRDYATGEKLFNALKDYLDSLDQIDMDGEDYNWQPSEFNAKNLNADGEIYLVSGAYILIYPYINEWAEDYFRVLVIDAETCELDIQIKNGIENIFNKFKTDNWRLIFED